MAEPSGSPNSSSSPLAKRLSEEPFPKLSESLEDKNVERAIILSVQPLSSHPLPTFDSRSSTNISRESPDNPVQTMLLRERDWPSLRSHQ